MSGLWSGLVSHAVISITTSLTECDGLHPPSLDQRTLTDDEIRQLWKSLPDDGPDDGIGRALRLCLITGQRLGEVCGLSASELDLRTRAWNIPAARTKNGNAHSVPLT